MKHESLQALLARIEILSADERRSLWAYLIGYDPDAVASGIEFVAR